MHITKRTMVAGAAVAGIGLAGLGTFGIASAATDTSKSNDPQSSLVDKIASKFGLQKSDVQAVFDENRTERHQAMEQKAKDRLVQAVKDGKLTQAQADHITGVMDNVKQLVGDSKPNEVSDDAKQQIKSQLDELRQWAKDNKIDLRYLRGGVPGGHGMRMMHDDKAHGDQSGTESLDDMPGQPGAGASESVN